MPTTIYVKCILPDGWEIAAAAELRQALNDTSAAELIPAGAHEAQYEKDPEAIASGSHMNGTTSEAPVTRLRAV